MNKWLGWNFVCRTIDFVSRKGLDVLCLQEIIHCPTANKEWSTYREGEPELSSQ